VRSEVLTAVKVSSLAFWVVTPCGLVGRYQRFGGTYCRHHQDEVLVSTCKSTWRYNSEDQHRQGFGNSEFHTFVVTLMKTLIYEAESIKQVSVVAF
jgi:hypothetical protein